MLASLSAQILVPRAGLSVSKLAVALPEKSMSSMLAPFGIVNESAAAGWDPATSPPANTATAVAMKLYPRTYVAIPTDAFRRRRAKASAVRPKPSSSPVAGSGLAGLATEPGV